MKGVMIMSRFLKSNRLIVLDQWINCYYRDNNELCKITKTGLDDDNTVKWKVVCYYWGNDILVGTLQECICWIEKHMI